MKEYLGGRDAFCGSKWEVDEFGVLASKLVANRQFFPIIFDCQYFPLFAFIFLPVWLFCILSCFLFIS